MNISAVSWTKRTLSVNKRIIDFYIGEQEQEFIINIYHLKWFR